MNDGIGKAQSYGKYEVFGDVEAVTWEQAEALALKARGKNVDVPKRQAPRAAVEHKRSPNTTSAVERLFERQAPAVSKETQILNRALILLIHLREKVFKENPEVEKWVNDILAEARAAH